MGLNGVLMGHPARRFFGEPPSGSRQGPGRKQKARSDRRWGLHGGLRSCTLGGNFQFFKDRKYVILGVWAAPGARETIPLGGGLRPPPFARVSGAPGAAQTPKMTDFRPLNNYNIL